MKILNHFILNPFWLLEVCTLYTWGLIGAAAVTTVGGIVASESSKGQANKGPAEGTILHDRELAQRSLAIQKQETLPEILDIRREFDPQFIDQGTANFEQAFKGVGDLGQREAISQVQQQRSQLLGTDIGDIEREGARFGSALDTLAPSRVTARENLQANQGILDELRSQAQSDLALGGQLSEEEIRRSQQASRAATGARGRGSGSFAVGQEILGRDRFARERQGQRRQFAGGVFNLGGQQQQSALQLANFTQAPFLNAQAQNRQIVGSPLQQFLARAGLAQDISRGVPSVQAFDPNVVNIAQGNQAVLSGQATQARQSASETQAGIIGGSFGAFGQIAGAELGRRGGGNGAPIQNQQEAFVPTTGNLDVVF